MKKLLILLVCILTLGPAHVSADTADEVRTLLMGKIDGVIALLRQKEMDKNVRNDNILELVRPVFDFKKMAQLTLGKRHWPGLSPKEQEEFSELFTQRIQESYLEKLDIYSDEEVVYEAPLSVKTKVHIPVNLISKNDKTSMLYKFYNSSELGWQIYDVELQGVSVVQTYRTQFHDVLKNGTIGDLMTKLKGGEKFETPDVK